MDTKYAIGLLNTTEGIRELRDNVLPLFLRLVDFVLVKKVIPEGNQCPGSSAPLAFLSIPLTMLRF